jgi:phosphatidylserine/phosphatidylglycerophosphate/cardiolipin synthase-like enzyme
MYELGNQSMISALERAHREGCSVQVELDGTERQSIASAAVLAKAGVQVRLAHISNNGIDHIKALSINGGAEVLIGGVNWGQYSNYTVDADVLLFNDPAVAQRLATDWGNNAAGFSGGNTSSQALEGPAISIAMDSLIASARHRILVITNYLTSYNVQDALAAAAARGVVVDVVLNRSGYGSSSAATWLSAHDIHVRYAPASPYLHAKVILTTTAGLIGSANLSYDGLNVNRELDTVIPSSLVPTAVSWAHAIWIHSSPVG